MERVRAIKAKRDLASAECEGKHEGQCVREMTREERARERVRAQCAASPKEKQRLCRSKGRRRGGIAVMPRGWRSAHDKSANQNHRAPLP